jgi:hypothetical protein
MTPEQAADRVALRALVEEYAWMADTFDYQGYAALFTADATFAVRAPGADEPFVRIAGHEALMQALHANDRFAQTFHAVHNHRCEVDGDQASGVTYCVARHHVEADSTVIITPLRYHDTYLRTPNDGWRFGSRDLRFTWVEKVAADPEELERWTGRADGTVR